MIDKNAQATEQIRTDLERIMVTLPPLIHPLDHQFYLAGYIDCLADKKEISEEQREILYAEYAL
jgi:hypothetical protein